LSWIWLNQILSGILLGGYYALLACGLSLLFGVMRIINLAHGDLAVLSAFLVWLLCDATGISPFLALIAMLPVMALIGWGLQRFVLERSLKAGMLVPLLSTFGLAIVIENLLFARFGADTRSLAPAIGSLSYDSWAVGSHLYVGKFPVLVFVVAVLLLVGLQLFLRYTQLGRTIRATAEDPDTAELCGIDSRAVYGIAAAIAVATLAIAGTCLAIRATFDPYAGPTQLIFAFEAVVIGGIGSLWGTLAGGIILGVAQNVGAMFDPHWFLTAGHITFLAVLALRLVAGAIGARGGLRAVLGRTG
jgi:branched-chain amino acid transport system permease protein